MRQELLWVPPGEGGDMPRGGFRLPWTGEATERVWTLYRDTDPDVRPVLPFRPQHHYNAFLEDAGHDWTHLGAVLRYFSRVSTGGHWLLLEFK